MPTIPQLEAQAAATQEQLDEAQRSHTAARDAVMSAHEERHEALLAALDADPGDRPAALASVTAADQAVASALQAFDEAATQLGL